jgi:hypothetical protein
MLALGLCGCHSLAGVRYHEGAAFGDGPPDQMAEVLEGEHAMHHGEESPIVQPPHSRFHPVPTRPVFEPNPEGELAMTGAVIHRAEEDDQSSDDPVPPLAAAESKPHDCPTCGVAPASHHVPLPVQAATAKPSSRKPTTLKSLPLETTKSVAIAITQDDDDDSTVSTASSQTSHATSASTRSLPDLGDGWRPRVAQ